MGRLGAHVYASAGAVMDGAGWKYKPASVTTKWPVRANWLV